MHRIVCLFVICSSNVNVTYYSSSICYISTSQEDNTCVESSTCDADLRRRGTTGSLASTIVVDVVTKTKKKPASDGEGRQRTSER